MKEKFQNAAEKIRKRIGSFTVFATWYENGEQTFSVKLERVEAVEREDGWHLLGYDKDNKEYCIGGAVVASTTVSSSTLELYKP
ncbi:MAG: hypothetical protein LBK82_14000 [Planctomycetaceae bacterium]|jgi:hypothetical protein|nr:hypothetical protein [Planctomycetaceae bacterium]